MRSHRKWAVVTLVGGVVCCGRGAPVLAVWQNGLLPAAEDKLAIARKDALDTCPPGTPTSPPSAQDLRPDDADAQGAVDTHRTWRLVGFIGAGVGAAVAVTGIVLLATGPSAEPAVAKGSVASTLEPIVVAGPAGASLGLRGRF